MFAYEIIWEKNRFGNFLNAKIQPLRNYENIVVFYTKQPTYNPQKRKVFHASTTKSRNGHSTKAFNIKDKGIFQIERENYGEGYPTSIIKIDFEKEAFVSSNQNQNRHPTQKPVKLMEYLIKTFSNEGDTVFDGYLGSGTTAIAAHNTNRNFIGCELDKQYFELAQKRINRHTVQTKLF